MRFTMRPEAIERLGLSPELKGREFAGPAMEDGVLAGFTVGENRWGRKLVGAKTSQDMDPLDVRVMYYFLAVRRDLQASGDDVKLLPPDVFDRLSPGDFEVLPHLAAGDEDEGCIECGRSFRSPVHLAPEGDD